MPSAVQDQDQDQSMMDAAPQDQEQQYQAEDDELLEMEEKRIVLLPGATETAASFQFEGEGHTLGNALRFSIMKNPQVEFCGYTIPHPSETKMNLRIQTTDDTTATDALQKGLDDLMDLCDVVTDKFSAARDSFNGVEADRMVA